MVGGASNVLGDIEPAAAIAGDGLHRDIGDGEAAGHHTAQGIGGIVGQQLCGIPLAAGEECPLQPPHAADGSDLEAAGGLFILSERDALVLQKQVAAGGAVLQTIGRVAHQRPHLLVAGGGRGQRHLAVAVGQTAVIDGQGVVAAVVVGELKPSGRGGAGQSGEIGGQRLAGGAVGRNAVIAIGQRRIGVLVQHHNGVRRFIDVQAGVDAELHIAGAADEVGHRLAGDAVLPCCAAGHPSFQIGGGGFVQLAALGVDGLNDLRLALVFEASQRIEGTEDHTGGAAASIAAVGAADHTGAVVHAAAPEHVAQCQ